MANCPSCNKHLTHVDLSDMPVSAPAARWSGVVYACPWCRAAISVSIDPISIKNDIISQVLEKLRR